MRYEIKLWDYGGNLGYYITQLEGRQCCLLNRGKFEYDGQGEKTIQFSKTKREAIGRLKKINPKVKDIYDLDTRLDRSVFSDEYNQNYLRGIK